MLVIAILLVVLNIADASISYWAIEIAHVAYEANPFMLNVLDTSPYLFFGFKIIFPLLGAVYLYKHRDKIYIRRSLFFATLLYFILVIVISIEVLTFISI